MELQMENERLDSELKIERQRANIDAKRAQLKKAKLANSSTGKFLGGLKKVGGAIAKEAKQELKKGKKKRQQQFGGGIKL